MTNEEAVKMLRTMQRTVYLGNRKFEDAIECAIKALSEPLQPWEVLVAQAVLPQSAEPKKGKWIKTARWGRVYYCNQCRNYLDFDGVNAGRGSTNFCPNCGAKMEGAK